tara:strand:+ start:2290 stop:2676 length:387 start_codon:yes stop_codon:yes gene_type:complete
MSMRGMVQRSGQDWIYTTFATGARDAYEDEAYTADATPPTIKGLRIDGSDKQYMDETGEARLVDVNVLFPFPVLDTTGQAVSILDSTTTRAATLTDDAGRVYKIVGVGHEASVKLAAIRVMCARQADS